MVSLSMEPLSNFDVTSMGNGSNADNLSKYSTSLSRLHLAAIRDLSALKQRHDTDDNTQFLKLFQELRAHLMNVLLALLKQNVSL